MRRRRGHPGGSARQPGIHVRCRRQVFGGKQPRSYFESHVNDDPFLSALSPSDILVIDVDGQIASSLRLVPRQVYINGGTIVHTVVQCRVVTVLRLTAAPCTGRPGGGGHTRPVSFTRPVVQVDFACAVHR